MPSTLAAVKAAGMFSQPLAPICSRLCPESFVVVTAVAAVLLLVILFCFYFYEWLLSEKTQTKS